MPKPRIVQALCGPSRHCIMAFAYDPGITAAQADFGSSNDVTLTEANAADYLASIVDGLIERKVINPWCELCRSTRPLWIFDDRPSRFETLAETVEAARQCERDQLATQQFLRGSRG